MKPINLSQELRSGGRISSGRQAALALRLSVPAILAQFTNIIMEYIDAAMVGRLGAEASASVGLVASTTWLVGGLIGAAVNGFSVQVAQAVGAGEEQFSRSILRQAITANLIFGALLAVVCTALSGPVPSLLGAGEAIRQDASAYLRVYSSFLPVISIQYLMIVMLQCAGDMKTPGACSVLECLMNMVFNYLLIFPAHTVKLSGHTLRIPGAGMGVEGAALGTVLSVSVVAVILTIVTLFFSDTLALWRPGRNAGKFSSGQTSREEAGPRPYSGKRGGLRMRIRGWIPQPRILSRVLHIALPIAGQETAQTFAQVVSTRIVAPLGAVAIAANSFAVTAEALCYMPGYGIGMAATTLTGQAYGAGRKDLAKSFAWMTTGLGMVLMGLSALLMYFLGPFVFRFLTPDAQVQALGVSVLRIGLLSEPLFGASIVGSGALRGAGDTLVPAVISLCSIWGIRIVMAALLVRSLGLQGVWIAMVCDLCVRGVFFLIRIKRGKWLNAGDAKPVRR